MRVCYQDCKMLKNKKFMGKISEQLIRTQSKPLIAEVNNNEPSQSQELTSQKEPSNQQAKIQ